MGKFKVYIKRGAPNHREQKLMSALQKAIDEKMASDPTFKIEPARSFTELQKLHTEYCTELIDYEEVPKGSNSSGLKFDVSQENIDKLNTGDPDEEDYDKITKREHPMVKEAPKVRDYVLGTEGFTNPEDAKKGAAKSSYEEPKNFDESFKLPDDSDLPAGDAGSKQQLKKEKPKPLNPSFDEIDTAKQRRKSKQFSRMIVSAVCTAAKYGFIWYANKDINEAKLVEYEIEEQIDLGILLTMEDQQQVTVKNWFLSMNIKAEQLAEISQEDQDDLTDALTDVLLEKGFVPTPVQQLLIVGGTILLGQGLKLASLKMQTSSVLTQLRVMKKTETIGQPEQQESTIIKESEKETVVQNKQESSMDISNEQEESEEDNNEDLLSEDTKKNEMDSIAETAIK